MNIFKHEQYYKCNKINVFIDEQYCKYNKINILLLGQLYNCNKLKNLKPYYINIYQKGAANYNNYFLYNRLILC